jgi:glycosyltransferase involved in cell wall biosynthesis
MSKYKNLSWFTSNVITIGILVLVFGILFIRKSINKINHDRIVAYREPLVSKEFYKLCRPVEGRPRIVWIMRHYLPDFRAGAECMAHDINLYLIKIGWEVIVIVPHSSVNKYEEIRILQFYQKTEIELELQKASCIFTQYQVLETAVLTSLYSKIPLVVFAHDDSLGPLIKKLKTIHRNIYLVNNSVWIQSVYQQFSLQNIILYPPVDWRKYITHTRREYITMVNLNGNKGAEQFFRIVKALPEYNFLGVRGSYAKQYVNSSLRNLTIWDSQLDMRSVYSITGILCVPSKSESWGRVAIEAASSGIPVIASPTPGLKEALGFAGLYADRDDTEAWVKLIRELKENSLFYKEYSDKISQRAKDLDPTRQLDEFQAWVQETKWQDSLMKN